MLLISAASSGTFFWHKAAAVVIPFPGHIAFGADTAAAHAPRHKFEILLCVRAHIAHAPLRTALCLALAVTHDEGGHLLPLPAEALQPKQEEIWCSSTAAVGSSSSRNNTSRTQNAAAAESE